MLVKKQNSGNINAKFFRQSIGSLLPFSHQKENKATEFIIKQIRFCKISDLEDSCPK